MRCKKRMCYDNRNALQSFVRGNKGRLWLLDGATVLYGSASELMATLDYDFSEEKRFRYKGLTMDEMIHHLAVFTSGLWQIHVFGEGNTRTTAVFLIKYLRTLGFDVNNDIFAENALFFKNALVRANYNDLKNGVHETTEYLELFLKNLLLDEKNELHNRTMHIRWNQKQDIGRIKQDTGKQKPYIGISDNVSNKTKQHIYNLCDKYGTEHFWGRAEVMELLKITASPASELIKKMLDMKLIVPITGHGKGKYRFWK